MRRTVRALLIGLVVTAGLATPALAFQAQADRDITLARDATASGTYYAASSQLEIDGTINGDLVCAAERVVIRGTVTGDMLCAARDIVIEGRVDGDARLAAQTVAVSGRIGRNASVLTQTISTTNTSVIGGELMAQAATIDVSGTIGGETYGSAERVTLNGAVTGPVKYTANVVRVGPDARLNGGLEYTSATAAAINPAAQITGEPRRNQPPAGPTASDRLHSLLVGWIISLLSALLLALALVWLFPRLAPRLTADLRQRPGGTGLLGLALLVLTPLAALLVMLTVIGIPLAVLALIGWGVAWYLSRVVFAITIGRLLYPRLFDGDGSTHPYRQAVVGVILTWLVFLIPYVGAFASFVATILGAGLIMRAIIHHLDRPDAPKRRKTAPPVAPAE